MKKFEIFTINNEQLKSVIGGTKPSWAGTKGKPEHAGTKGKPEHAIMPEWAGDDDGEDDDDEMEETEL